MLKRSVFFMLVGLPGSGKSVYAQELSKNFDAVIYSSDAIREELFGDASDQTDNEKVFETMFRRSYSSLQSGINVIYDATNISYKRRKDLLGRIKRLNVLKVCYVMATPYKECISRIQTRARVVPYSVLEKMYRNFYMPGYYEGWDSINLIYSEGIKVKPINDLFMGENGLVFINQDNPHHDFTIGEHCDRTYNYITDRYPRSSDDLKIASLLHDIGKTFTKTFTDRDGNPDTIAHYYDHHHVSAYESMFYVPRRVDAIKVANIIQWHMRPYQIEKSEDPEKAREKFKKLVGDKLYSDIMILHEADKNSQRMEVI